MKRALGIGFGFAVAALCLWLFFRGIRVDDLQRDIAAASVPLLVLLAASSVVHLLLRAYRWRTLLGEAGRGVPFIELFSAVSVGYMASLLPARVGEVLRPTLLSRRTGVPLGTSFGTVAADRLVLDLPMIGTMLGLALVLPADWTGLGAEADPATLANLRLFGLLALAGAIAGFVVAVLLARHRPAVEAWLHRVHDGGQRRGPTAFVARVIASVLPGLSAFATAGGVLRLAAETAALWAVIAAGIHCGVAACDVRLAPLATLLIVPVTALGIALGTPGGAGTYQIAMKLVLVQLFRTPESAAVAAGIVVHVVSLVPMIALGTWFALRRGLHGTAERRPAPDPDPAPEHAPEPAGSARR